MPSHGNIDTRGRRAALVKQIAGVFRARGYEGATLSQLAAVTGLGRASLYHHFPGGKAEMADVLIRQAIADAQRLAFQHLDGTDAPDDRLRRFLSGFGDYLERGGGACLLGVLAMGSAHHAHDALIEGQFRDWQSALARVYEAGGHKPKRAGRLARELLNAIYGAQVVARLCHDPRHLQRSLKRLSRQLSA